VTADAGWLEAVTAPPDAELVVAVSGGADSAFLAWAMTRLADPQLVHVDHGTPNAPSLREAARRLADHLGRNLTVVEVTVPSGPSWEAQARAVRRAALRDVAGQASIATGHHSDDQAETVLGNLVRGAGAAGLGGMAPVTAGWCKPLLGMTRTAIRSAVADLALPFVDDPSNEDTGMRRNLIRHEVLPVLDGVFPGISERLVASAGLLAVDDAALERQADALTMHASDGAVELSIGELNAVDPAVAARVVRRAVRVIDGTYPGTASDVDAALAVAGGVTVRTTIGGDIVVEAEHGLLVLRPADAMHTAWEPMVLSVPGTVEAGAVWVRAGEDTAKATGARRVRLDAGAIGDSVLVRPVATGDRIDIGSGHKLISDALREAAIRVHRRSSWPVVEVSGRIAWLVGVRPAAWAVTKMGEGTVMFEMGAI
jgi:tRNA(Ile)-lysidine synthase